MQHPETESWINVMVRAAGRFGLPADAPAVRQQMRWFESLPLNVRLERLSGLMGLQVRTAELKNMRWNAQTLPVIVQLESGELMLLEAIDAAAPRPAAIVGFPVGFVGAAESKDELAANPRGIPFATLLGRKGGSAMAAAVINALTRGAA